MSEAKGEQLPKGWLVAPLQRILCPLLGDRLLHHGWSPQCDKQPSLSEDEWGVLKTTSIQAGAFLPEHNKHLPSSLKPRPQLEVQEGDILITCAGPRNRCGVACLVRSTRKRLILSGKMYRFRVPDHLFEPRYLEAFFQTSDAQSAIDGMKTGISDSGLNLTHERFLLLPVPVAPLNEQRRFADALDELLSDLDAGVAALERAQTKLTLYRAAVLKAAVEGTLTAEWRKQNPTTEPASELLKRILIERRRKWEQDQLRKYKEAGRELPKGWKAKYKEPKEPDASKLPALPEEWCWANVEQVCHYITKGTTPSGVHAPVSKGEIPFIKVQHLSATGAFLFEDNPSFVAREAVSGPLIRSKVFPEDILMNIVGPPLGQVSIVPATFREWNLNQAIAIYRCVDGLINKYLARCLQTNSILQHALKRTKTTAGQVNITLEVAREIPIPLPPLAEQQAIVETVEDQLSVIDHLEADLEGKLRASKRLRQAILKHAFSGKLVSQDPNDEPASELLKRIAAERATGNPSRTRKRRGGQHG